MLYQAPLLADSHPVMIIGGGKNNLSLENLNSARTSIKEIVFFIVI